MVRIHLLGRTSRLCHRRRFAWDTKAELTVDRKLEIENKWRHSINSHSFDETNVKDKYYVLSMFPYPSGNLHMGHVRVYTISDTIARYQRMNGKNVLHPIGFDSFGLPAENAAFQNKIDPSVWTEKNVKSMRDQLVRLGCNFDWNREIMTSRPEYYKFTQYMFLLLHHNSLVYQKKAVVNWDPIDKTVLADEQVDNFGKSWRSGALVEKKLLSQWFIRTTRFAESLLKGLNDPTLKDWRDVIKLQQHWLGECNGADFLFRFLKNDEDVLAEPIWTSHPEHMPKAAFVAASPSSIISLMFTESSEIVALNPINNKRLPVYITEDVTYPAGCDLKLGIPCLDETDASFASSVGLKFDSSPVEDDLESREEIRQFAIKTKIGGHLKSSKLRDWLISRQRHWGTPIPIVHCVDCGAVPVGFESLPVVLPPKTDHSIVAPCPNCGRAGKRETDTMDTFVDSSWYFLRYLDPKNPHVPFDKVTASKFMPVDLYIGGKEHATLHLYYARFMSHFLHSIGLLDTPEPFLRLLVQGMVMGQTFYVKNTGKCISSSQVTSKGKQLVETDSGLPVIEKWEKMSKSKHNGVEPSAMFERHGVDTTRLFILSAVAPTTHRHWKEEAFDGILNWQRRIWTLVGDFINARSMDSSSKMSESSETHLFEARNLCVKEATFSYSNSYQLSAAISRLQSFTNTLKKCDQEVISQSQEFEKCLGCLIIMLAPMAPHFASELWEAFRTAARKRSCTNHIFIWSKDVLDQKWPTLDDEYPLPISFKVNNAVKATVQLPFRSLKVLTKEEALSLASEQKEVKEFIGACDVLGVEYDYHEKHDAVLNISIDHLQKWKLQETQ